MDVDAENILVEIGSGATTFGCAFGIYSWFSVKIIIIDVILLVISSFLPSRVGTRVGCIAGIFFGPIVVNRLTSLPRWENKWPDWLLDMWIFVGSNGKFILGVIGAVVGSIAFIYFYENYLIHRYWCGVLAASIAGLSMGIISSIMLITLAMGNDNPSPEFAGNMALICIQNIGWAGIGAGILGLPFSLIDFVTNKIKENL